MSKKSSNRLVEGVVFVGRDDQNEVAVLQQGDLFADKAVVSGIIGNSVLPGQEHDMQDLPGRILRRYLK